MPRNDAGAKRSCASPADAIVRFAVRVEPARVAVMVAAVCEETADVLTEKEAVAAPRGNNDAVRNNDGGDIRVERNRDSTLRRDTIKTD